MRTEPTTIDIEPIDRNPGYQAALVEPEQPERRLAETEQRGRRALALARGEASVRSVLERSRDPSPAATSGNRPGR